MAARRGLKQLVEIIDDAETLQSWIEKSEEMLVVVDLFKEWCGYCSVMEPTYNSLFNELDDFDNRVKLLAVCINLLFAWFGAFKVQQALQINADKLNEDQLAIIPVGEGCKPGFVVFKHKVAIGKIQGANAPEIQTLIKDNVFPLKKDE